jgi:glycosyltransferase involved in cell wall biosynthesis
MKRVLFVDHVDRVLGGAEINLIELLAETRGRELWEIACACRSGSQLDEKIAALNIRRFDYGLAAGLNQLRFTGRGFPWLRTWRGLQALADASKALRKIIREFKADIVVTCTNKDHFAAVKACSGTQTRTIWWVNDLITKDFFPWPARLAFRKHAGNADRFVPVSGCVKKALLDLGILDTKIRAIENGIPFGKYRRGSPGSFRARHGLPASEPLFGVIGRFSEWKGQDIFLHVAWRWITRGRPGHFVLVGRAFNEDQWFETELRNFVASKGLEDRVHFVGFQEDVAEALTDLDVLLHTSKRPEPFGRTIVEAMAIGTPVVAANAGGAREIIEHGKNGLLARPGDVEDYVTKLREAWPITAATRAWTEAAHATVAARFNVERVRDEFAKLIEEIY